jgi:biopolymer transport protein ExbD
MVHKQPVRVGFDMTPMIDVTFNLLVFFLLTSEFAKVKLVRLKLPEPLQVANKLEANDARVLINVTELQDPGGPVLHTGNIEKVSYDGKAYYHYDAKTKAVTDNFDALLQDLTNYKKDRLEIELRADRHLKMLPVMQLMQRCADKGIKKVHFVGKK